MKNSAGLGRFLLDFWIAAVVAMGCLILPVFVSPSDSISNAQDLPPSRKLPMEFVPESGCPIEVTSYKAELDLDPFGAPIDARTYVDYKNVSPKPIVAVKFRLRFYDQEGKERGTMHAPDGRNLEPGGGGSQKWKTQKVDPRVVNMKMRVLIVKYADGTDWQSVKMQEIVQPPGAAPVPPVFSPPASQNPVPTAAPASDFPPPDDKADQAPARSQPEAGGGGGPAPAGSVPETGGGGGGEDPFSPDAAPPDGAAGGQK